MTPQPPAALPAKASPQAEMRAKLSGASPLAGPSRLPTATPRRRRTKLLLIITAVVLAAGGLGAAGYVRAIRPSHPDLLTHTVQRERLELTVVERGALESTDNRDVFCRVKSGAKNSTVATTIKRVVDDGSFVKKDELIVELDDSGLIEQLKTQKITLDKARSDKVQSEEQYKITVSQNESDIKTAETNLQLALIDLEKYQKGDFPQALKDVQGRIKVAEADLEQQRDRSAWADRMVKKGYQTVSQAQAEQSKMESLQIARDKVREEERVLTDPNFGLKKRTETDLGNKVAEAERALKRVQSQAKAKEVKDHTDQEAKRSIFEQEEQHYKDIEEEIRKCKIHAPQDGMVVYYIPEQSRFGSGSQQSIVAQGEPVREGQKLMQIPDLKNMLVTTKVHEAMVSRVKRGQKATVRIDAFPDRVYPGHVASVATIASQGDWSSADVKVYPTKVVIDEQVEGLKPGMSAEVTITVGDPLEQVLTVPVQAIVGSVELGSKRHCFVLTPNGPVSRDIVVGLSNDRMAEVREGLQEGEKVVLNPKVLVGNTQKTREAGAAESNKEKEAGPGHKDAVPPPMDKEPGSGPPRPGKDKARGPRPEGGPPPDKPDGPPGGPRPEKRPKDREP